MMAAKLARRKKRESKEGKHFRIIIDGCLDLALEMSALIDAERLMKDKNMALGFSNSK